LDRAVYVYASATPDRHSANAAHGRADALPLFADRPKSRPVSVLLAMLLSLILPGAGHWYLGLRRVGVVLLTMTAILLIAVFTAGYATGTRSVIISALYLSTAVFWAAISAQHINRSEMTEK
jgi:hypothetical protein